MILGNIHTIECYRALRVNKQGLHATIWMRVTNLVQSENIQTQKVYDSIYITFKKGKTNLCVRNQLSGYPWGGEICPQTNYATNS